MSVQLFDFQQRFISDLYKEFGKKHKRVVGNAITGFGKTITAGEIVSRAVKKDHVVCILVHRQELLDQFITALAAFKIYPSLIIPGSKPMRSTVYVGMVETFFRRLKKSEIEHLGITFFILDECHYGSYSKVLDNLNVYILGLTATAKSTGKPELKENYEGIVIGAGVTELIELKRLVPGKTYSIKHDFSGVKKKGGDYEERSLLKELKDAKLYDGAVQKYIEICPERKAMCFCVNVEHALDTANQFRNEGFERIYHVDGSDSYELYKGEFIKSDRRETIARFKKDEHAILTNVGVATAGFDCPDVGCIIENFATQSIVKHHQVVGRGARAHKDKEDFIIIDMGRNWIRHKRYGQEVEWEDIFNNPCKAKPQDGTERNKESRECEGCGMVIKMKSKDCPYCGEIYSEAEIDQYVKENCTVEEIKQHRFDTLPADLRKPYSQMSLTELQAYGKHMNYKPSWAWTQHKICQSYKNKRSW